MRSSASRGLTVLSSSFSDAMLLAWRCRAGGIYTMGITSAIDVTLMLAFLPCRTVVVNLPNASHFNIVPHAVVTPKHKIIHNCDFVTVMNHNITFFLMVLATPMEGLLDPQRGL